MTTNPPEARELIADILRHSPALVADAQVDGQHISIVLADGTRVSLLHVTSGPEPGIRDHIREWHPRIGTSGRSDADLARWHGQEHFQFGSTTHHHGPNAGPHARPRGWRDGSGVVPIDRRSAMRRRPEQPES